MSFAAGVRQTCRRSFATAASPAKPNPNPNPSVKALVNILDSQSERQQARQDSLAAKSDSLQYHSFQVDQFLKPNSLSFESCTRSRPTYSRVSVAPTPAVARQKDIFYKLNLDPRGFSNNSAILCHFVTEMGKIKPRTETSLTVKSQRLLGRTIRRAKMMGVIPMLSK